MNDEDKVNVELTTEIVSAYVGNNPMTADQIPALLQSVYQTMTDLGSETMGNRGAAFSVEKSFKEDRLTCLECGKSFKSIKRHLKTSHDLSPQQYRKKWNLGPNYPMIAPHYSEVRSQLAKDAGFGKI